MGVNAVTLKYLLLAEDRASKVLGKTGGSVDQVGKKVGGMSKTAKVAFAAAGVAAVGFANASINKFQQVTLESRSLQRAIGGTLEQASRFREAAILSGVDAGTFTKSAQKLDKTLVSAAKSTKTQAAMVQTLGFNFLDAHGKVKPMGDLIPQIADKFAALPDGANKTALAMQLFGKAGTQMLPFLSKGSKGIADLEKQSDKFGTTLSSGAIDSVGKMREQQRQWSAGMDGLKVQIGAQLLPILIALTGFIQDHVIPIVQKITGFIRDHKQAMAILGIVIGTVIVGLKLWAITQAILNTVMAANPIALVVIAVAALAAGLIYAYKHSEAFRKVVQTVWGVIKTVIMGVWNGYLKPMFLAWKAAITALATVVMWLWHTVIKPAWDGIVAVIRTAWGVIKTVFGWIKSGIHAVSDVVSAVAKGFGKVLAPVVAAFKWIWGWIEKICGWITDRVQSVVNAVSSAVDTVKSAIGITTGGTVTGGPSFGTKPPGHKAMGGRVTAGVPYIVGENRPELFVPDGNGTIVPRLPKSLSNGPASVKVDVHTASLEREIRRLGDRIESMQVRLDGYLVGQVQGRQADRMGRGH